MHTIEVRASSPRPRRVARLGALALASFVVTSSSAAGADTAEPAKHLTPPPPDASGATASPIPEIEMKSRVAVVFGVSLCVLGGATATLGTVAIATAGEGEWSGYAEAVGGIVLGVGLGLGAIGTPLIIWGAQDEPVVDRGDSRPSLRLGVGRLEIAGSF